MYTITDLKPGRAINLDGEPYLVLSSVFGRKSQSKANMQCKLKNLQTGAVVSRNFQGSEKIDEADIGYRRVQFLYGDGESYTFMDAQSYDQFSLDKETLSDVAPYMKDGMELDAIVFDEKPIGIKLPATVNLEIVDTPPGVKGDTAQGGSKPATLETGLVVQVPLFLNAGVKVKINTETGEYMSKAE